MYAVILQGKLPVDHPLNLQPSDRGFRRAAVWTRLEELGRSKSTVEFELRQWQVDRFFVHEGDHGLLSVVLDASDECQQKLRLCGFEATTALTGLAVDERDLEPDVRKAAIFTWTWGRGPE